jgi:hypothetical protein
VTVHSEIGKSVDTHEYVSVSWMRQIG